MLSTFSVKQCSSSATLPDVAAFPPCNCSPRDWGGSHRERERERERKKKKIVKRKDESRNARRNSNPNTDRTRIDLFREDKNSIERIPWWSFFFFFPFRGLRESANYVRQNVYRWSFVHDRSTTKITCTRGWILVCDLLSRKRRFEEYFSFSTSFLRDRAAYFRR